MKQLQIVGLFTSLLLSNLSFAAGPIEASITTAIPSNTTINSVNSTRITLTNNLPFTVGCMQLTPQAVGGTFTRTGATTCTSSLASNASCVWAGDFTPAQAGNNTATLLLHYANRNVPITQSTTTNGQGVGQISLSQSGAPIPNNTITINQDDTGVISVTNTGTATINNFVTTVPAALTATVTGTCTTVTNLAVNQSCQLDYAFTTLPAAAAYEVRFTGDNITGQTVLTIDVAGAVIASTDYDSEKQHLAYQGIIIRNLTDSTQTLGNPLIVDNTLGNKIEACNDVGNTCTVQGDTPCSNGLTLASGAECELYIHALIPADEPIGNAPGAVTLDLGSAGTDTVFNYQYAYNIIASGDFTKAGGVDGPTVNYVARFDGTQWYAMDGGVEPGSLLFGGPLALTTDINGDIITGGLFTTAGGTTINYIARFDGTQWQALNNGMNNTVSALHTAANGDIIAGGEFTTAGGTTVNRITRFNGTQWQAIDGGTNGSVLAVTTIDNGNIIAGGAFATAGGTTVNNIAQFDGTQWLAIDGGVSRDFGQPSSVLALTTDTNGNIIAGGKFTQVGADNRAASRIIRFDGAQWQRIGGGMNNDVKALALAANGDIIAGGRFTTAGGTTVNYIARFDGTQWQAIGDGVSDSVNAIVMAASLQVIP